MKAATDTTELFDMTTDEPAVKRRASDFSEITKLRLNLMVLVTTLIGFVVASPGPIDTWLLLTALVGTALSAAGASVLNQAWEWRHDKLMHRTADRPVAAGRMTPGEATSLGLLMSVCGTATLGVAVNVLSASLALSTILLYVLVYTPLKRVTTLNTVVGAIPGAIPPLIGCAAAAGALSLEAWGLFAILFCWQMPHFLAIAILCKDDYAAAGFKMLPVVDTTLTRTHVWSIVFGVLLIAASMVPLYAQPTSVVYTVTALLLGAAFLGASIRCAMLGTRTSARVAFFASIIYLPLLLLVLMIDRLF